MGKYADGRVAATALERSDKHKQEADRLKAAIRTHYQEVHGHDWGADDKLWATIGLEADVEVIG